MAIIRRIAFLARIWQIKRATRILHVASMDSRFIWLIVRLWLNLFEVWGPVKILRLTFLNILNHLLYMLAFGRRNRQSLHCSNYYFKKRIWITIKYINNFLGNSYTTHLSSTQIFPPFSCLWLFRFTLSISEKLFGIYFLLFCRWILIWIRFLFIHRMQL